MTTSVLMKGQVDIRTGQRVVLGASVVADEKSPTLVTATFCAHGSVDPYVVPAGSRLILTGVSGRGGTVVGDYFELGEIGVSGTAGTVFTFVPVTATPVAISEAGGGVNYWTLAEPLAIAVNAGEALHFSMTHAKPANASFTAILTGYLADA